jgi:putative SOS response-associated peptidase YedK
MPVILSLEHEKWWLSRDPLTPRDLAGILVPFAAHTMAKIPVSDLVNTPP